MKIFRYCLAFLVTCTFAISCEVLNGDNSTIDESENVQEQHFGCKLEIPANGVTDENLLALCINLTHEYKYDFQGLENCSWVRISYAQNVDGCDWIPYITVDPNTTGIARSIEIIAVYDQSVQCRHTIVQLP